MSELKTHIAMDGNSYTEYFEDASRPGGCIAVFHPQFGEQGYHLMPPATDAPTAQTSRLGQLLRRLFGEWPDPNDPSPPQRF